MHPGIDPIGTPMASKGHITFKPGMSIELQMPRRPGTQATAQAYHSQLCMVRCNTAPGRDRDILPFQWCTPCSL